MLYDTRPDFILTVAAADIAVAVAAGLSAVAAAVRWVRKSGAPRSAQRLWLALRRRWYYRVRMTRGRILWIVYSDIIHVFLCIRHFLGDRTLPRRRKWLMDLLWITSCAFLGWYWKIIPLKYFFKLLAHAAVAALTLFYIPAALASHPAGRIRVKLWFATAVLALTSAGYLFLIPTQLLATL